mmetsp:Transcript_38435/g.110399  ORF Transcript_38435/g.110399 Transcript_38435/m.110399 type:complete len:212 (-) Transcript_38435:30-665(-)
MACAFSAFSSSVSVVSSLSASSSTASCDERCRSSPNSDSLAPTSAAFLASSCSASFAVGPCGFAAGPSLSSTRTALEISRKRAVSSMASVRRISAASRCAFSRSASRLRQRSRKAPTLPSRSRQRRFIRCMAASASTMESRLGSPLKLTPGQSFGTMILRREPLCPRCALPASEHVSTSAVVSDSACDSNICACCLSQASASSWSRSSAFS